MRSSLDAALLVPVAAWPVLRRDPRGPAPLPGRPRRRPPFLRAPLPHVARHAAATGPLRARRLPLRHRPRHAAEILRAAHESANTHLEDVRHATGSRPGRLATVRSSRVRWVSFSGRRQPGVSVGRSSNRPGSRPTRRGCGMSCVAGEGPPRSASSRRHPRLPLPVAAVLVHLRSLPLFFGSDGRKVGV